MNSDQERDMRLAEACRRAALEDHREALCADLLDYLRSNPTLSLPQTEPVELIIPLASSVLRVRVEPNGNCVEVSTGECFYRLNGKFLHPT